MSAGRGLMSAARIVLRLVGSCPFAWCALDAKNLSGVTPWTTVCVTVNAQDTNSHQQRGTCGHRKVGAMSDVAKWVDAKHGKEAFDQHQSHVDDTVPFCGYRAALIEAVELLERKYRDDEYVALCPKDEMCVDCDVRRFLEGLDE